MNKVTIVVSTLGRENNIKKVLSNFEIQNTLLSVVIINASKDKLDLKIFKRNSKLSKILDLQIIETPGCSLALARELGVKRSLTDYVCFVDDDIELPYNYLKKAISFLESNKDYDGVGGIYYNHVVDNRRFVKHIISRLFGICGKCKSNSIKCNGWADKPLGQYKNIDTDATWLYGCNGIYRKEIFFNNIIETRMHGWSFLEDVIMGYRACKIFGSKFRLLNDLKVFHSGEVSSGEIAPISIKMRILYRYLFWKEINKKPSNVDILLFSWSMVGNLMLMLKQAPSFDTIKHVYFAHKFIISNKGLNWSDANAFITEKN